MFENDISVTRGHRKGLISDGGVYPDDSVIDCLNMDFFETEDRRRLPYSMLVNGQEDFLPPFYTIIGFYEKEYIDADSNVEKVLIVVAKHSVNFDIKIYTNKYYNPSAEFGNNHLQNANPLWEDSWTELTEIYRHSKDTDKLHYSATVSSDPLINRYTTTLGGDYDKDDDYFKGFWVYYVFSGACIGQVTKFTNAAGTQTFEIAINSNNTLSIVSAVVSTNDLDQVFITRFPLNVFAGRLLRNKVEISSISQSNPTIIALTPEHGFKVGDVVGIDEVQGMTGMNGLYLTVTAVSSNYITVSFDSSGFPAYTNGGRLEGKFDFQNINSAHFEESFNAVKICIGNVMRPIEVSFLQRKKYWSDAITTAAGYTYKSGWDGFYFAYDIPKIENIGSVLSFTDGTVTGTKYYGSSELGREIGLRLALIIATNTADPQDLYDTVSGVMVTLDGYQYVFLKYAAGRAYTNGSNQSIRYSLKFDTHYLVDFDRRFTATNYFGDVPSNIPEELIGEAQAFKELLSFQFAVDKGGVEKTTISTKVGTLNYYRDTNANRANTGSDWHKQNAIGITLNSALNEKYYHSPVSAFRFEFRLNRNLIGVDINKDYLATDLQQRDNYGLSKIAISNIQFGVDGETPVNAEGCFGEERIRHLIQGYRITAGSSTIANQFALFTEQQIYHFELVDDVAGKINEIRTYLFAGTYSNQTMVKAKILDNFAGLYYINNSTIYRFLDNAPEDLLVNRWKDEYQLISQEDKRNAIVGYMPYTKEVYFKIGSVIYIWNIVYENWKKYSFRDIPTYIASAISGQLYFTDGTNIYAQEIIGTTLINDQTSDQVNAGIGFKIKKRLTHGSTITNKIPDRVDIVFEMDSEFNDIADLEIKIGKNGSENNILDSYVINMTDEINSDLKGKKSIVMGAANNSARTRANFYDVTMQYNPPGDGSPLKFFKLKELLINAKKGLRQLTKI